MPTTDLMYFISYVQTDATTPTIVHVAVLGVVASVLAVVCKRMQQLPTLTTRRNMQQGVETDAICNIQQCWELLANNVASVCTGLCMYPANTSFIHITRHWRSFYMVVALRARKIRYYLVQRLFFFFFSTKFIEITVCYWTSEFQDYWILSKFFQKKKRRSGNSQLSWIKHLTLSFCTSHYRSMQEVQLDKHVKLVDSPGIVMDNSNSDSAVILRNCVKVRFHSVVQEWPTLIFS